MFDDRLISNETFSRWGRRLGSIKGISPIQHQAIRNFMESCFRYAQRRSELHMTAIQMHEAGRLNKNTMEIQQEFYYRTEVLFQGLYSCISQLANVVHRFPEKFNKITTGSNKKFISTMAARYRSLGGPSSVLEEARDHRTFLDHPVKNQVADWMTTSTGDERELQIIHFGRSGTSGNIPAYAERSRFGIGNADWRKITPNHFEIEQALKAYVDLVIRRITR